MKNIRTLLIAIVALFIAFIIGWLSLFNIIQPNNLSKNGVDLTPSEDMPLAVDTQLHVDFEDGSEPIHYYHTFRVEDVNNGNDIETLTAYSMLEKASGSENFELETQQYDFGIYIKSIGGFESTTERSWIYFVNGESGSVASDQHVLKPGDVVEWRYIKPE